MKDAYPQGTTIPEGLLVPAGTQPDYTEIDDPKIDDFANVGDRLCDAHVRAGRGAEIAAIHFESGRQYTFAELAERSSRLAAGLLELGVRPGDRVAYRTPNDPEALVVMLAIWKSGGVLAPVPAHARPSECRHYLADSGARYLFAHARTDNDGLEKSLEGLGVERIFAFGDGHDKLPFASWDVLTTGSGPPASLPRTPADLPAIVWHTGGTTGKPKGCYHTHRRFLLGGYLLGKALQIGYGQRWAAAAPIGHALGLIYHTIYTLLNGATAVFVERYQDANSILEAVESLKIETFTALTATWAKMADELQRGKARDTSSLRLCYAMWQSASASEVYDFWHARGVPLLNNFGSTAFATWVLVPQLGAASPRASLGRALPGFQVEAVEVKDGKVKPLPAGTIGRMAVKGPTGLTYWGLPDLQTRDVVDGWSLSDDILRFDADGNAEYLGRTDYMISSAGFKIAPVEVENELTRHAAVREVSVVPAPCPIRQEMVVAYVALNPGFTPSEALKTELRDCVKAELSSYKAPRRIEFIESLPRDALGKVQTRLVKMWAAGEPVASKEPT